MYGSRIMRNFVTLDDGRVRNMACFEEWQEAKRIFEARKDSANRTNSARSPHGHRTVTDGIALRPAYTRTGTVTETDTETTTKTKTLARSVPPEELAGTLPLVDGTLYSVSKQQVSEWTQAFPAVDVKIELRKFKVWLDANPTRRKTPRGICKAIVAWLGRAQDKSHGSMNGGGFNGNGKGNGNLAVLVKSLGRDKDSAGEDGDFAEGGFRPAHNRTLLGAVE
jgi:hypothetical protein